MSNDPIAALRALRGRITTNHSCSVGDVVALLDALIGDDASAESTEGVPTEPSADTVPPAIDDVPPDSPANADVPPVSDETGDANTAPPTTETDTGDEPVVTE